MIIQKFEDIIAWQKAQDFAVNIYSNFKELKDFGFKDQICRAVVSVSNNIAEGFERNSDAEFKRFLYISFYKSIYRNNKNYKRFNKINQLVGSY